MNDKKGKNIVNDSFAHKPDGLLVKSVLTFLAKGLEYVCWVFRGVSFHYLLPFSYEILKSDLQYLNFILNLYVHFISFLGIPINNRFTFEFRQAFRYFSSQFLPSLRT